jgi:hypothetical protein
MYISNLFGNVFSNFGLRKDNEQAIVNMLELQL